MTNILKDPNYLFFWGHYASFEKNPKVCLSQWDYSPFYEEEIFFPTAEHYMMYKKAMLFGDEDTAVMILKADMPKSAKFYGRKVKNFNDEVWNAHKFSIVRKGNLLKFTQHPKLGEYLLSTAPALLVEASPYDSIWGIGKSVQDPSIDDTGDWGENLLGKALTLVRSSLI